MNKNLSLIATLVPLIIVAIGLVGWVLSLRSDVTDTVGQLEAVQAEVAAAQFRITELEKSLASASITLDELANGLNDANQGGADSVDCIFCPLDIYSSLELQLEGQRTRVNADMADIGFRQNIEWVSFGATIYPDPYCEANTVYGINKNHTRMYIHPALNMEFSGFKEPTDQAAITGQLKLKTQMACDDRAKNFKLTNVNP